MGVEKEMVESEIIYHSRLETEKTLQFSLEEYSICALSPALANLFLCVSDNTWKISTFHSYHSRGW